MSDVTGRVEKFNIRKTKTGKNMYSLLIEGTWYSTFDAPGCGEGDIVEFNEKVKGDFHNVDGEVTVIEKSKGTPPEKRDSQATDWDLKDRRDKYAGSMSRAVDFLALALAQDAIKLPTKQAEKLDALTSILYDLTDEFYLKAWNVGEGNAKQSDE